MNGGAKRLQRLGVDWIHRMRETNTLGLAAQVAFWVFLALLPLAAVLGLVVARLALAHADLEQTALASLPDVSRELISGELARVASWNGGAVAPLATVTFVWLASGGVHAIFDAIELQVGASRPYWQKRAFALLACMILSVGVAAIALLTTSMTWAFHRVAREVSAVNDSHLAPVWYALRVALALAIATCVVAGLYWMGTPAEARARIRIWRGATFAVAFNALAGWGYGLALKVTGIGAGYGAGLTVIGVTMTSLYLASLGVLAGAALGETLGAPPRERARVVTPLAPWGAPQRGGKELGHEHSD